MPSAARPSAPPTALDDLGLAAAVERLAEDLAGRGYDVRLSLLPVPALSPAIEAGLFRVAQEALNNVRSHAGGPCRVDVALCGEGDGTVSLCVGDAGRGFDPTRPPASDGREHLGLAFMRERMAPLGGAVRIDAVPGTGVSILAKAPAAWARPAC